MVNAQEYINKNYPTETRKNITQINSSDKELEGKFIIQDFPNLEKFECRNNKELTSVELNNLPKLNYFHANNCQLTDIKVDNCPNIVYFNIANNLLTDLKFLDNLNPEKLTVFSIHSNNFSEQILEPFSKFVNLQQLFLDNCDKSKFRKGIYNRFTGSLKPLQNLTKLEILSIGKTDIDSGLEYLPKNFRKIGFNSAIKVDTGCSKLSQELEEATKIEGVTEKLQQHEENDPTWISNYYRISPWRQALDLLGEEEFRKQNTQQWLDKNYSQKETEEIKKRKNIIFLNINDKNLKGHLDLRDFTNLEKLDCSDNKLINLDLSKCPSLTHLYCDNNLFTDLNFLKILPHPEKMKELYLGDNEKLPRKNLDFLIPFAGLEELNIDNCPFQGSLKTLKKLEELKRIYISNTDIDDGLDDLPENCQRVYCDNSQGNKKSIRIVKQFSKYSEEKFDENSKIRRYYDLEEWRENKQNNMIASIIPLERLYVIRGNIRQFLKKWGIKNNSKSSDTNVYWYRKLLTKEETNKLSELSKLKSPEELSQERRWKIYLPQFIGRGVAVAGAVLTFQDYGAVGGGILGVYPFVELGISKLEKDFEDKKNKWKDFLNDADNFLDNYHELLGILSQFEIGNLKSGEVNKTLKNLDKKIREFLADYDEDDNQEIDMEELITERNKLAQDLDQDKNSKVQVIIEAIKKLEESIIEYRKSFYYGKGKNDVEVLNSQAIKTGNQIEITSNNNTNSQLLSQEVEKAELDDLQIQVEQPPK